VAHSTAAGKTLNFEAGVTAPGGTQPTETWAITEDNTPIVRSESSSGPDNSTRIAIHYGAHFHGIQDVELFTSDGKNFTGTVDGQPLAPLTATAGAVPQFADGKPVPPTTLDPGYADAISALLGAAKQESSACAQPTPTNFIPTKP